MGKRAEFLELVGGNRAAHTEMYEESAFACLRTIKQARTPGG
jgi:hypothetical protein